MARIGKSKTINFQVTVDTATQCVVIFSSKHGAFEKVYQQFSYPTREGFDDLSKNDFTFSGKLSEEATEAAGNDLLIAEIKAWNDNGQNAIKRVEIAQLVTTRVQNIKKVL